MHPTFDIARSRVALGQPPQHAFRRDGNGPRPVASLRGGLGPRGDQRPLRIQTPNNRLSTLERQRLLAIANSDEFGHLPPSQIVPRLADRGQYVASESTFNLKTAV